MQIYMISYITQYFWFKKNIISIKVFKPNHKPTALQLQTASPTPLKTHKKQHNHNQKAQNKPESEGVGLIGPLMKLSAQSTTSTMTIRGGHRTKAAPPFCSLSGADRDRIVHVYRTKYTCVYIFMIFL